MQNMGLQIRCPLCGMSRPPEHFRARELGAKEVTSRGGNRGFEHTEVSVPPDLQQRLEREIELLYLRYADLHPVEEEIEEAVGETVEEAVGEIEEAVGPEEIDVGEIEEEIVSAAMDAAVSASVERGARL